MLDIDVDASALTLAEQRMLSGLAALLDPLKEGRMKVLERPTASAYVIAPSAPQAGVLELRSPSGVMRARITRPIVLGALKRMMIEAHSSLAKPQVEEPIQARAAVLQRPIKPAVEQATVIRKKIEPMTPAEATDPRGFVGISLLAPLLEALMRPGPGVYVIRFPDGGTIRADRANQTFRCKNLARTELYARLTSGQARWAELQANSKPKTDETQASMSPLLFALGVASAKEKFILGNHADLEFQIRNVVSFARYRDFQRIAEAFQSFAAVADAAMKLSIAPTEVIACINGYAAMKLVDIRPRGKAPAPNADAPGFLARLKSSLGV